MPTTPEHNRTRGSLQSLALVLLVVLGATQAWSWWQDRQAAQLVRQHAQDAAILMYTTNTCPYCARARSWLDAHEIAWQECNVDRSDACARAYAAAGSPGVPLLNVKGRWHLGFDAAWLAKALQAAPLDQASPRADTSPRP